MSKDRRNNAVDNLRHVWRSKADIVQHEETRILGNSMNGNLTLRRFTIVIVHFVGEAPHCNMSSTLFERIVLKNRVYIKIYLFGLFLLAGCTHHLYVA